MFFSLFFFTVIFLIPQFLNETMRGHHRHRDTFCFLDNFSHSTSNPRRTCDGLERALEFHLVDTMMSGLAVGAALGDGLLAGTTADAHAVDDESLLGAITLSTRTVG